MRTLYFKVRTGFKPDEYIPITKDELEKAQYAFLTKDDVMFDNGVCKGKFIISIAPDIHRSMGWNEGYELDVLDHEDVKAKIGNPHKWIAEAKMNVDYYIDTNQAHLIGTKPLEIAQREKEDAPQIDGKSSLIEGMRA